MKATFHTLTSADKSPWKESVSAFDGLPIRDSGAWIATKHRLLTYYAHLFATGMKYKWKSRVYLELFSGPGRCLIRKTGKEDLGSPLKVIEHEFTKFIFTEMSVPVAGASPKGSILSITRRIVKSGAGTARRPFRAFGFHRVC